MKPSLIKVEGFIFHMRKILTLLTVTLLATLNLASCTNSSSTSKNANSNNANDSKTPEAQLQAKKERGRIVYQANCIACHHSDPKKPGSLGPDVFGSSKELLEARILEGTYPSGYSPKRGTHMMPPLKQLKNEIEALHTFLNSNP